MEWFLWKNPPRLPQTTAERGAWAEKLAERHLRRQGLRLITRNYRCRDGELDLIMRHNEVLVFIEVRFRTHDHYGGALLSINEIKCRRIRRCARGYLAQYPHEARRDCRFDVVTVDGSTEQPRIDWIPNFF